MNQPLLSQLPSVDRLLKGSTPLIEQFGHQRLTGLYRDITTQLREDLLAGNICTLPDDASIIEEARCQLEASGQSSLRRVLNLTGTVLHTNLGRATLPDPAIQAISKAARGFCNLEFDLNSASRGDRDDHVQALIQTITGAEAVTVVNNNAAAVLLTLSALAQGREVPVSRGELVEIGGSFRIPEVMSQSGCSLVEVGATNRTHARDYQSAISERTACLMKVHTSNYEIQGFTSSVGEQELAEIAHEHGLPLVTDLGSGTLVDLSRWGLPREPTVQEAIEAGADVVTFSGDKLLGGPQCGIIVGRKDLIARIKAHPLKRALRVDKLILAALYEVLQLYLNPDTLNETLPTLRQLSRPMEELQQHARVLLPALQATLSDTHKITVESSTGQIGSGALPVNLIPSISIRLTPETGSDRSVTDLARRFRSLPVPVIGRIHDGSLYFDLRTLDEPDELMGQLANLPI